MKIFTSSNYVKNIENITYRQKYSVEASVLRRSHAFLLVSLIQLFHAYLTADGSGLVRLFADLHTCMSLLITRVHPLTPPRRPAPWIGQKKSMEGHRHTAIVLFGYLSGLIYGTRTALSLQTRRERRDLARTPPMCFSSRKTKNRSQDS